MYQYEIEMIDVVIVTLNKLSMQNIYLCKYELLD